MNVPVVAMRLAANRLGGRWSRVNGRLGRSWCRLSRGHGRGRALAMPGFQSISYVQNTKRKAMTLRTGTNQ
jgi:hypothetical protein